MADKATYLNTLKKKHRELDKKINTLYNQYVNEDVLKELKYQKLDLKMQITRLETQLSEAY
jgi:hypothetical protein